ncbi:MAG: helix-turn-helix domain-containing protein [Treponema sp.]
MITNLFCIEKHITQEQLAELCNTDTCYIGQIETLRRFPSIHFIEKIAAALQIEAYELFKNHETTECSSLKNEIKEELLSNMNDMLIKTLDRFL